MSEEVKEAVETLMSGFEEFKKANDQRLKQIEQKGTVDVVLVEKVERINESLNKLEGMNQKLTLREQEEKAIKDNLERLEAMLQRPGAGGGANADEQKAREYKAAFNEYVRKNGADVDPANYAKLKEYKALVAGNDTLGGYYLAPAEMQREIIKDLVEVSPMRAIATVTSIGTKSLQLPKRTGTFSASRVAETGTRSETTGYTTGMVEINAPDMYAEVHISEQMLEDAAFDLEAEMRMEFQEQFAVLEGTEFISGSGVNAAEGILTNSGVGSINSGNATAVTADGVLNLYYEPKTVYARSGIYVLNRATLKTVRTLKDGQGQYLWMPGLAQGQPNTINGATYVEMPDMPSQGANTYPIAFGDFRRGYRIVDRILISILRDPYTQSGNGKIRYLARKRTGGGVVLAAAIKKLKCSA